MKLFVMTGAPGSKKYLTFKERWQDIYWDSTAKAYSATPTTIAVPMTEDSKMKGVFKAEIEEDWPNAQYMLAAYTQSGETASPEDDGEPELMFFRSYEQFISELQKGW